MARIIMCQGGKPDTGKLHSSYIGMNVCWYECVALTTKMDA